MGKEIERKFLITSGAFTFNDTPTRIVQGYILLDEGKEIRVRLKGENQAFITFKHELSDLEREEIELSVNRTDAEYLIEHFRKDRLLVKDRYEIIHDGLMWEIDVFCNENRGLMVAEVELTDVDQPIQIPAWVGREVTHLSRYRNSNLVRRPFELWSAEEKEGK